ncbi:MAG: hypothetical protein QOH18_197 [Solirubrobacterales bacterium]|nr:hypothetical protein [Solirubrobacterales bacterium]
MPAPKRKTRRNPLQRLSDQRRSLALAGLAVGAVFSAAILRRKRRGGEAEFGQPVAPTDPPATPEPAPTTPAELGTAEPEVATEPEQPSVETSSSSISDPATGELSAEEASILAVLAQHGRSDDDRTVIAVATSLERESADVSNVLRKLNAEGVVEGELYTATGDKIWAVTERGVRRLGAQH